MELSGVFNYRRTMILVVLEAKRSKLNIVALQLTKGSRIKIMMMLSHGVST